MRIVYLNPSGRMGGAEVALLANLASLRRAQPVWELRLIASEDGTLAEKARALGVATRVLPFPVSIARLGDAGAGGPAGINGGRLRLLSRLLLANGDIRKYLEQLRLLLLEIDADLIHSNGLKMHILAALAKPADVPLIWHIHDYVSARPLMARLIRRFQDRCSLAVTNSDSVKADLENVCGKRLQIETIYNRIDTNEFSPDGAQLDLDMLAGLTNAGDETIRVGLLATFARWKGHEVFLKALSLIPRSFNVRGYLIGDALYQTGGSQYSLDELKKLARKFQVEDRVGFTGFVADANAAIRALDIVVHASTQPEPFGLVIIEGMSCGKPVIVSAAGGATELIDDGVNALTHEPGNAGELAERIMQLAGDVGLRQRLGDAGRASVEKRFDNNRTPAELVELYDAQFLAEIATTSAAAI
ncbi:MAG TPA: glycosyltransferase family 4 protein [Pyrinomonadaceae bacterium]|jgi:glycosyltransferase involved in cell wall biosynthesis|nr:glycosyltransferase family 4 protein [Pyrinomonadaceae bacterium]